MKQGCSDYTGTPLERLVADLNALIRQQAVQTVPDQDGRPLEAVILRKPLKRMLGPSVLARLIGGSSLTPLGLDDSFRLESDTRMEPAIALPGEKGSERRFQLGESCLGFPTDGGPPVVLCMTYDPKGWPAFAYRRRFLSETAEALADSRFVREAGPYDAPSTCVVPRGELRTYLERRHEDLVKPWKWVVPRCSVARCLWGVIGNVGTLHKQGKIHGDIKPSNLLVTASGPLAIDSLRLSEGLPSPAMTRVWAAPEQVIGAEVQFQTDQYPLGLMLLALVGGVLYGEESTMLVPTGGSAIERHTLLRNPGMYIDPKTAPLKGESARGWRKLVERCLRFLPSERFPSMEDLAGELHALLEQESLRGEIEVPLAFGRLVAATDSTGQELPCWVVA
jgi:hypothetical protein